MDTHHWGQVLHVLDAYVTHADESILRIEAVGTPRWESLNPAIRGWVVADEDSSRFIWHIDRKSGRLVEGYRATDLGLWFGSKDSCGGPPVRIKRWERVELLPEE